LERLALARAIAATDAVTARTDRIEVGASTVRPGRPPGGACHRRRDTRARRPQIADDVRFEFETACAGGATSVTVIGLAPDGAGE